MRALVIGGSGPTGPHVLTGLLERGYDVAMLHRGVHEPDGLPAVRHIHADPHFASSLEPALAGEDFDLVVAMYGRLKAVGQVVTGRCGHLVGISGVPVYRGFVEPQHTCPYGMKLLAREDSPKADATEQRAKAAMLVLEAERSIFEQGRAHGVPVTSVRYPQIYGPRNIVPWEWAVVRRVLDGRRRIIVPDDGLWIISRCAARNAAEVVLRIVDRPQVSGGEAFNCADEDQFTLRQWVELAARYAGGELEIVGIPSAVARSAFAELLAPGSQPHMIVNTEKARAELGYVEAVTAYDALRETVEWMIENPIRAGEYPLYPAKFDYALDDRMIDEYRRAVDVLNRELGDKPPQLSHPMPHPKALALAPGELGTDERGR
jgi:nucleoside-diphosphate-sugar epimerase